MVFYDLIRNRILILEDKSYELCGVGYDFGEVWIGSHAMTDYLNDGFIVFLGVL